jgi:hypothetical protein
MSTPTLEHLQLMRAFLHGYIDEGALTRIPLDRARAVLEKVTPAHVTIDGMVVSRILRRLGFQRSYLPTNAAVITYRKVILA